ncbi:serine threonine- kinase pim-2-like protein [Biomphalaria glabrata]|nr:serine threonine- kinase pim-2-like protein [Biomphalaria glabrata]
MQSFTRTSGTIIQCRRAGGWNNNPNVRQFKATFKKLLVRCGVQPGKTGNGSLLNSFGTTSSLENSSDMDAADHMF